MVLDIILSAQTNYLSIEFQFYPNSAKINALNKKYGYVTALLMTVLEKMIIFNY